MTVDLFLFAYRATPVTAYMALNRMIRFTTDQGVQVRLRPYGNALIHRSRNAALAELSPDADYALFVDDDMLPPHDALVSLLAHDKPIVSALCSTRSVPVQVAAKIYHEPSDQFVPFDWIKRKTLEGKFAVGTGFLLIRRDAIEQVIEYFLSARDWIDENRRVHDRLHARVEFREKERERKESLRRINYEREKTVRVFDYPVVENELQLGEDMCFARKLLNLHIPVVLDGKTIVGHLGEYAYTVNDMETQ